MLNSLIWPLLANCKDLSCIALVPELLSKATFHPLIIELALLAESYRETFNMNHWCKEDYNTSSVSGGVY